MTIQYIPKKRSPLEVGVDYFIWFGLAFLWVYVVYHHGRLPDTIATHFDAMGNPTSQGSKDNLFMLPLILTLAIVFLKYMGQFPQYHNYPMDITKETAPKVYQLSVSLIRYLGLVLLCVFWIIVYGIIQGSYQNTSKLSPFLLPLVVIMIFMPIGIGLYRMVKIG